MDYRTLETLRQKHPAWRLLKADYASFIVAFLYRVFVEPNVRTLSQSELVTQLDDYLYLLRREVDDNVFPRDAQHYLDEWASNEHAWLRKYHPPDDDEAHFDITSATEKVIDWLVSLGERQFVGTASRLMTVFDLLHQLVEGTQSDPGKRIASLERRKGQIEAEIKHVKAGQLVPMDSTEVKEHFLQIADTARGLLSDFREVEQNFRELDRGVRERIATWDGRKADLLDSIFSERDAIADSDQGKSFRAFWNFLMSPARQEELSLLLSEAFSLEAVQELAPDHRLLRVHYDWLEAGETAQRTVARLSEQLRRYLDDQAWLENRRIMDLIRNIEQTAIAIRQDPPDDALMRLDDSAPNITLTMERGLFSPPFASALHDQLPVDDPDTIPADALFDHVYVDKARLSSNIRRALQTRAQVSLAELVNECPLEEGLAELVAYLSLAADDDTALIDDDKCEALFWTDNKTELRRRAVMPLVVFSRAHVTPAAEG